MRKFELKEFIQMINVRIFLCFLNKTYHNPIVVFSMVLGVDCRIIVAICTTPRTTWAVVFSPNTSCVLSYSSPDIMLLLGKFNRGPPVYDNCRIFPIIYKYRSSIRPCVRQVFVLNFFNSRRYIKMMVMGLGVDTPEEVNLKIS